MDITGIQNSIKIDLLAKSPQAIVDAWKVGQLVNGSAVSATKNGQATVSINGALLLAQTQFPLKLGQPLQLEVSSLAALTVLKVIRNASSNTPPITVSLPPQNTLSGQLQSGQQLNAILTRPADANQTRILLELAGNRITVQLSQPLPPSIGQQIKLEVVTPGAIAALKILTTIPATSSDTTTVSQAMRSILPRQTPLPALLGNLAFIARAAATPGITPSSTLTTSQTIQTPALPQSLVELVRTVVNRLPRNENISTADGLKQAVAQSGLFMEARLAQALQQPIAATATAAPPVDFKGGLLSLLFTLLNLSKGMPPSTNANATPSASAPPHAQAAAQATLNQQMNLQQTLGELVKNVNGGLARLQLSQLVSSAPEEDGKRAWVMELPVRSDGNIDLIQLRIEKDNQSRTSKKLGMWTVTLALELSGLGPVQARITLADKIVNTHFWAENAHTTELINEHLKILHNRYHEVGLNVGALKAHHGTAPEPAAPDANLPHILLDEKI